MSRILEQNSNWLAPHPSGGEVFGQVPVLPLLEQPSGPIYLRAGNHFVRNGMPGGYGIRHIWSGKQALLYSRGIFQPEGVPAYLANLISIGAPLFHDFTHRTASKKRITLLQTRDGTVVLEPRQERELGFHYQIVTWTPRIRAKGILVGTVTKCPR